jgi:Caspase domain/Domain of unknown function (DUF4189)
VLIRNCVFLIALLIADCAPTARPLLITDSQDRFALVIGNSGYRTAAVLPNALNDAFDVAAALERLGFEVTLALDVDSRSMNELIDSFAGSLPHSAIVVFYFAGHGLQIDRENYLLATDTGIANVDDVLEQGIKVSQVIERLSADGRAKVIILDACRNNPWLERAERQVEFGRSVEAGGRRVTVLPGLAQADGGPNTLIVYSTQPDNVAADGTGRNSPFTRALVRHIEAPHEEIREILGQVRYEVMSETGKRQVPWDHSSLFDPIFFAGQAQVPLQRDIPGPYAVLAVSLPYQGRIETGLVSKEPNLGRAVSMAGRECKSKARECSFKLIADGDECIAVAIDPETLSVGWSKAGVEQSATDGAVAHCRESGGQACVPRTSCNY